MSNLYWQCLVGEVNGLLGNVDTITMSALSPVLESVADIPANKAGHPVAAVSLAGPTTGMTDERLELMRSDLIVIGKTISMRLGTNQIS